MHIKSGLNGTISTPPRLYLHLRVQGWMLQLPCNPLRQILCSVDDDTCILPQIQGQGLIEACFA